MSDKDKNNVVKAVETVNEEDALFTTIVGLQTESAKEQGVLAKLKAAVKAGATQYVDMLKAKIDAIQKSIAMRQKTIDAQIRQVESLNARYKSILDKAKTNAVLSESEIQVLSMDSFLKLAVNDKSEIDKLSKRWKRSSDRLAALRSIKVVA